MLLTTVKKCENPLTINSVYAGLSFGFFLKLQEERRKEKKVRDPEQTCTVNQRCRHQSQATPPSAGHPAEERGGDTTLVPAAGAGAHHWEMKSTKSGEKPSEGSCGDGSSTTCLSCWNGVPHDS